MECAPILNEIDILGDDARVVHNITFSLAGFHFLLV